MATEKEQLIEEAKGYGLTVEDADTTAILKEKLQPIHTAIESSVKSAVEKATAKKQEEIDSLTQQLEASQEAEASKSHGSFKSGNKTYEFVVPKFRYKGEEYDSKDVIENKDTELLKKLVEAKSFVIKAK